MGYLEGMSIDTNSTTLSEDNSNNSSFEFAFEFMLGKDLEPQAIIEFSPNFGLQHSTEVRFMDFTGMSSDALLFQGCLIT